MDKQLSALFQPLGAKIFISGQQKELVADLLNQEKIPHYFDFLIRDNHEPFEVRTWVVVFSSSAECRRAVKILNSEPS